MGEIPDICVGGRFLIQDILGLTLIQAVDM